MEALLDVPGLINEAMKREPQIELLARELSKASDVLYLGRGTSYPLALEGALKLKEISYIHAEGYAAGELKHGPIALDRRNACRSSSSHPHDAGVREDGLDMQEVAARGGRIILITDERRAGCRSRHHGDDRDAGGASHRGPDRHAVPVQLLAYHTAVFMGKTRPAPQSREIRHGRISERQSIVARKGHAVIRSVRPRLERSRAAPQSRDSPVRCLSRRDRHHRRVAGP